MQQFVEVVYLPLNKNFQKDIKYDIKGVLTACFIILKTDSGQGCLVVTFSSIEFQERM